MKRLTPAERKKRDDLELRIRAAGVPIMTRTGENEMQDLLIQQNSADYESVVFDAYGGTGLILPLTITVNMPKFVFSGIDVRLDRWPDALFSLLDESGQREWPHYEFYGLAERKFNRSQSINYFFEEQRKITRGDRVHGLLLGLCSDVMPDGFHQGAVLRGSVRLLDQFDNGHPAKILVRAHREFLPVRRPNPLRPSLFSRPDFRADSEGAGE